MGIIPYLLLSDLMARLVRRFGKTIWLVLGFGSFAVLSMLATFVSGVPLLTIFVAWQISGALMESVHDLLFFDNTKKTQQTKYYGVFRTSSNLPNVIVPTLGAAMIAIYGTTASVWAVTATIGALSVGVLLNRK